MIETATVATGHHEGIRWEILSIGTDKNIYWLLVNGLHCYTCNSYLGAVKTLIECLAGE